MSETSSHSSHKCGRFKIEMSPPMVLRNLDSLTSSEQIELFLTSFFSPTDCFIYDPFITDERMWLHCADGLEQPIVSILNDNENKQRNSYFGVNPRYDKQTGGPGTAYAVACFADYDDVMPDEALERIEAGGMPTPSIIVMSGTGTHCYWKLIEPEYDLDAWEHRQSWIAAGVNSDPAVWDRQRVSRLPGTLNNKKEYRGNPPRSELIKCDGELKYSWKDLQPDCPAPEVKEPATPRPKKERTDGELTPVDDFMDRGKWSDALPSTWSAVSRVNRNGMQSWTHGIDGKTSKSATVSGNYIYPWSTTQTLLPTKEWSSKFFCYAATHHKGDVGAAVKQLAADGYGKQQKLDTSFITGERTVTHKDSDEPDDGPVLRLRKMADIEAKDVNWLWKNRIVQGGLCIITGAVGHTKSLLTVDLAARVSNGAENPDFTGRMPQGEVVMFGFEDDAASIMKPRLVAAGANNDNIYFCPGVEINKDDDDEDAAMLKLERDISVIKRTLQQNPGVRMLIFDPLPEFISGDDNSSKEVRAALMPLQKLAQESGVAIVGICHQNKKQGLSAVQTIAGSGGFTQVARTVLVVVNDPDDGDTSYKRTRMMVVAKSNYGGMGEAQSYNLEDVTVGQVRLKWNDGVLDIDAEDVIKRSRQTGEDGRSRAEQAQKAVDGLAQLLAIEGPMAGNQVKERMEKAGYSRRETDNACTALGVIKEKSGYQGAWMWSIPKISLDDTDFANFEDGTGVSEPPPAPPKENQTGMWSADEWKY